MNYELCEHGKRIGLDDCDACSVVGLKSQLRRILEERNEARSKLDPGALFEFIKHGDQEHQDWLREALEAWVAGGPKPEPRGLGKHGAKIYALEAEVKDLTSRLEDALDKASRFDRAEVWAQQVELANAEHEQRILDLIRGGEVIIAERDSLASRLARLQGELRGASEEIEYQANLRNEVERRLHSCELERDKYRAALLADRGEEAANRIRDEDRAFCLTHQTYFDSDIGCAKCNVVERGTPECGSPYHHEDNYIATCNLPKGHEGDCRQVFE